MDAVTLDHLIREIGPRVRGRLVRRVRAAGRQALLLEIERSSVWLDVGRETSGLYALDRAAAERLRAAVAGEPDARLRQALLHFKKHVEGNRVGDLRRIAGERAIVVEAGPATMWLRLARPASVTLGVGGAPLAGFGGEPEWPPPQPDERRAWPRLTVEAVAAAAASGARGSGALLAACPELGTQVARRLVRDPQAWPAVRDGLASPAPILASPRPLEQTSDAEMASIELWPFPLDASRVATASASWSEAAATFLELRLRGLRFAGRRRPLLDAAGAQVRRLRQLERHLAADLDGLAAEETLRRHAEALLAAETPAAIGQAAIDVPDPYDPAVTLHVRLDPKLSLPANADRLFDKARRTARARAQVSARLQQARKALADARVQEQRLLAAQHLAELPEPAAADSPREPPGAGPRGFLTTRGLMLLVGRGARENHELTFKVARPEDFWLHARDVPGAHVILRDPERRASPDDLREAAEVAAFFSRARAGGPVDVHVARRKHVQPAGGGPGRVRVSHSDTQRVLPRDPEGRLRKR